MYNRPLCILTCWPQHCKFSMSQTAFTSVSPKLSLLLTSCLKNATPSNKLLRLESEMSYLTPLPPSPATSNGSFGSAQFYYYSTFVPTPAPLPQLLDSHPLSSLACVNTTLSNWSPSLESCFLPVHFSTAVRTVLLKGKLIMHSPA